MDVVWFEVGVGVVGDVGVEWNVDYGNVEVADVFELG